VQWLRDGLHLIEKVGRCRGRGGTAPGRDHGVYMVPAFVGLGAPYWDAEARGALLGLTRDTGPAEIAAATLDSVCYQTARPGRGDARRRRPDRRAAGRWRHGGQRLADAAPGRHVGAPVERPKVVETTALGGRLPGRPAGRPVALARALSHLGLDRAFRPAEDAPRATAATPAGSTRRRVAA
jgi:glycerol kinase